MNVDQVNLMNVDIRHSFPTESVYDEIRSFHHSPALGDSADRSE